MNNKGFIVIEANQFWTDDMMALTDEGLPKMFFADIKTAEKYRINLEIKKWKSLFSGTSPDLSGMDYERPERDTLTVVYPEGERVYKIENQLYWIMDYFTLLSYEDFQEIEVKLKDKGFDLIPEITEEGISIFIEIAGKILNNFPKFYFVQEVELIED